MSIRIRHVYFEDDGTAHKLTQARYKRIMDTAVRESVPTFAGRRVRFMELCVLFEGRQPQQVTHVACSWVAFDNEGRVDEAENERVVQVASAHISQALFGDLLRLDDQPRDPNVVEASTRFEVEHFRWKPTAAQVKAALEVHGIGG